MKRLLAPSFCLSLLSAAFGRAAEAPTYVKDIKPIFEKHCTSCHGEKKSKGALRLDLKDQIYGGDEDDDDGKRKKKNRKKSREPQRVDLNSPMNLEAARAALDSIRIPHDVQDMIAELAKPGTSLIISERDLSHETGKGTEFVVLTR